MEAVGFLLSMYGIALLMLNGYFLYHRTQGSRTEFWKDEGEDSRGVDYLMYLLLWPTYLFVGGWDFVVYPLLRGVLTPRQSWQRAKIGRERRRIKAEHERVSQPSNREGMKKECRRMIQTLEQKLRELEYQSDIWADGSLPDAASHQEAIRRELNQTTEKIEAIKKRLQVLEAPIGDIAIDLSDRYESFDRVQSEADQLISEIDKSLEAEQKARNEMQAGNVRLSG